MIPQTSNEWRNCIENDCKINLTEEFARQRLAVYQDPNNQETLKFISLYGQQHLHNIIIWLNQVVKV